MSIKLKLFFILGLASLVFGVTAWREISSAYRGEPTGQLVVPASGYLLGIFFLAVLLLALHVGRRLFLSLQARQQEVNSIGHGELRQVKLDAEDERAQFNIGLEERAQVRIRQLEKANEQLKAFNSAVSHDLRGPLTTISGYTELLLEKATGSGVRDALQEICIATERMEAIISSLLDLSRAETVRLERSEIDLSGLVGQLSQKLQRSAPQQQAVFSIEPNLSVVANHDLLMIVLENLLCNAWKYSAEQTVTRIEFGRLHESDCPSFYVRDNGAGFDMSSADELFRPFTRLHAKDEFAGIGIGLATVQRIVEAHGGDVWAEGRPGDGATFYFSLPS